jgi:hypothetical protein
MKNYHWLFIVFAGTLFANTDLRAQVNAYAKVTGISGRILTVSNVNEIYHTFEDGDRIIILQMQDDVIGEVNNVATFGSLGSIKSAGIYEVKTIASHTEPGGVPGTITLSSNLSNNFNIGPNSSVQIVSFRKFGNPDYITTASMQALDWDGNIGGVLAFEVTGTLTLAHNITANAAGFVGGARSTANSTSTCGTTTWITSSTSESGQKGEGIYKISSPNFSHGRAKVLNGGGGGNLHNAGGGGGGNYTTGGDGGAGYQCSASPAGGLGGLELKNSISSNRIFMGGGGGGAQINNGGGSPGADGGGIILIKANRIITLGSCGPLTIAANGGTAGNSSSTGASNDGAGGGGAGGSIVLEVASFDITSGCTLSVAANGGNGGAVTDAGAHGGGGGGGQGIVLYPSAQPTTNVTTVISSGAGGCNSSSCTTTASTATGTTNAGVISNAGSTPLPVSLLYFKSLYNEQLHAAELRWATATELNNDYFTIERSAHGNDFEVIAKIQGNGTSSDASKYIYIDDAVNSGVYYYRLSQTDFDGTTDQLGVIRIELDKPADPFISVYPNPANRDDNLVIDLIDIPNDEYTVAVIDPQGVEMIRTKLSISHSSGSTTIPIHSFQSGIYLVRVSCSQWSTNKKIVIR